MMAHQDVIQATPVTPASPVKSATPVIPAKAGIAGSQSTKPETPPASAGKTQMETAHA